MECCRVCLSSTNLTNIFETTETAQHITAIACVDVIQNDGLPQYICLLCKHELDISINFKDKCETTYDMLKEQHSKEIEVKGNIILNLLSAGKALDTTLPESTRECVLNSVKNNLIQNGGITDDGNKFVANVDCMENTDKNKRELFHDDVASPADIDSLTDIDDHMTDDQLTDITETEIEIPEKLNTCLKCNFYFANDQDLLRHLERIHPKTMGQCRICLLHFPTAQILKDHLSKSHDANETPVFKCKVCNKGFGLQSELNVHLCVHPGERDFKCDKCNQCFKLENHLENHSRQAHLQIFNCKHCSQKFSTHDSFKEHLKQHKKHSKKLKTDTSNDGQYYKKQEYLCSCPYCNESCSTKNELEIHIEQSHQLKLEIVNVEEELFKCSDCNMTFEQATQLAIHRRCHIGNRPHVCSICQMAFYKRNSLEKHLLQHADLITCTKDETYVYDLEEDCLNEEGLD